MDADIGCTTRPLSVSQRLKCHIVWMSEGKDKRTKRNPLGDETEASAMQCTVVLRTKEAWGVMSSPAHASDGCATRHGYGVATRFQTRSLGGVPADHQRAASGLRAMWKSSAGMCA